MDLVLLSLRLRKVVSQLLQTCRLPLGPCPIIVVVTVQF